MMQKTNLKIKIPFLYSLFSVFPGVFFDTWTRDRWWTTWVVETKLKLN